LWSKLFSILKYATPSFRTALLDQLNESTAHRLVDKTIASGHSIGTLDLAMRELHEADPNLLGRLERTIGAVHFLRLIDANGAVPELFRIMRHGTPSFRTALLGQLNEGTVRRLVDKTIASGHPIGTLNLAMRGLGKADPNLLGGLERSIGAVQFLRLIDANGTVSDLFRILQCATPALQTAILDELNETIGRHLVDKTIASGRSIGTLHLAMQELGKADPNLLGRLERAIGAVQFLRIVGANGTLAELFKILEYATQAFRTALLNELNETIGRHLVDKTIASGRSIGTLGIAMRDLGKTDPNLLGRLERAIGAVQFLRLIDANGTVVELFKILEHATPTFRTALLEELNGSTVRHLVDKSIEARRSIGTLNLAMRGLGKADPNLLGRLERAIGAVQFLRLIDANGTVSDLFSILQYATPSFRTALLDQLNEGTAHRLVDKTIASGHSIGTLDLAMRELHEADPNLLGRLERAIGALQFLRLIDGTGRCPTCSGFFGTRLLPSERRCWRISTKPQCDIWSTRPSKPSAPSSRSTFRCVNLRARLIEAGVKNLSARADGGG
jgi:adenosine/AMP kinase